MIWLIERDRISERTKQGLAAARARGRKGGRPKGISRKNKVIAMAAKKYKEEGELSVQEICKQLGISIPTYYKYTSL